MELKEDIDPIIMISAYAAVCIISALGFIVAFHHRKRQKDKFEIIKRYEQKLGLMDIIEDILSESKKGVTGRINTSSFIVVAQFGLFIVSLALLLTNI